MGKYTREHLEDRWRNAAKKNFLVSDRLGLVSRADAEIKAEQFVPGLWEIHLYPQWLFGRFHNRKRMMSMTNLATSFNEAYSPDNDEDLVPWGWFHWRVRLDGDLSCYVLDLGYNLVPGQITPAPGVNAENGFFARRIRDVVIVESPLSMIGKFYWRIPGRSGHKFLFYFEMIKLHDPEEGKALADAYKALSAAWESAPPWTIP